MHLFFRALIVLFAVVISSHVFSQDAKTNAAKNLDYSLVGQSSYANPLNLTDQQRSEIADLLEERLQNLVSSEPSERKNIIKESNESIAALLSDEQKQIFATLLTSGSLRFNFYGEKWSNVLGWFAKQAGLSLVIDSEPSGLFTYNDTKEFSPAEAIDLLNSVLLSKNYTLIRREKMLILADTSNGIPYELVPKVDVDDLVARGRFEMVTVEFPLGRRLASDVVDAVQPLLGEHGQATPMVAAKKLLVTETAGKQQAINLVIASIPEPPLPTKPAPPKKPIPPVFVSYQAPGLEKESTEQMLQVLFPDAKIQFDPNAKVVHAQAIPETHEGIQASIEKMVASATGSAKPRLRSYPVPVDRTEELVTQLALVFTDLQIASDATLGRLLVVASEEEHLEVEETLANLDIPTSTISESVEIAVYPVDEDASEAIGTLMQSILPRAFVIPQSNRIVVRGTEEEQKLAKSTIDQLKVASEKERLLSFYDIESVMSEEMLTTLQSAVPSALITQLSAEKRLSVVASAEDQEVVSATLSQLKQLGNTSQRILKIYPASEQQKLRLEALVNSLPDSLADMQLLPNINSKEIAAWGTQDQQQSFEQLLSQLESTPKPLIVEPQRVDLMVVDPSTLLSSLQTKYPDVEFILNSDSNQLSYWASESEVERIQSDISRLTSAMPQREIKDLTFYELQVPLSSEMLSTLTSLVPNANVSVVSDGKKLSVLATKKDHVLIDSTLKQIEAIEKPTERALKLYAATEVQKSRLASLLDSLPTKLSDLTILPDPSRPEIAVWGSSEQHLIFAELLETLKTTATPAVMEPEQVELGIADSAGLLEALREKYPTVDFVLNDQSDTLYYWAESELLNQVKSEIQKRLLAMPVRQEKRLETYKLNPTDSANTLSVLQSLATTATFTVDPSGRWLMVVGTDKDHEVTESVLAKLSDQGGAGESVLIAYPLVKGDAESIVTLLQEMKPELTIVADTRSNRVLAAAPLDEHPRLQALISELDAERDDRNEVVVESYPLVGSDPSAVLSVVQPLFPEMQISVDENNRQLIASGTKPQQDRFAMTIKRVDNAEQKEAMRVVAYEVGNAEPAQVQNILSQLVPSAVISSNSESNRVLVWTDAESHQAIAEAIKQFTQSNPREERSLQTYPIKDGLAESVIAILEPELVDAKLTTKENTLIAWATKQDHEAIQVSLDALSETLGESPNKTVKVIEELPAVLKMAEQMLAELTPSVTLLDVSMENRWVVWADEEGHQHLEKILNSLSEQLSADQADRSIKVYEIGQASVVSVETLLAQRIPGAVTLEAQADRLFIVASVDEHLEVKQLIDELIAAYEPTDVNVLKLHPLRPDIKLAVVNYLGSAIPQAIVLDSESVNSISVWADLKTQQRVMDFIEQFEVEIAEPAARFVRVYPMDVERMTVTDIIGTLNSEITEGLTLQANTQTNSLIATGNEEEHQRLKDGIEAILEQLPEKDRLSTSVYRFERGDPASALGVLQSLLPNATIAADSEAKVLVVTADPTDQRRAATVVEQIESKDSTENQSTQVYRFEKANAESVSQAFTMLVPTARVGFDAGSNVVFVTASESDHTIFRQAASQLDGHVENAMVKVYTLDETKIDAETVLQSLDESLTSELSIQTNTQLNSLIVRGSPELQEELSKTIEAIVQALPTMDELTTEVYYFENTTATSAIQVLEVLLPDATFAADKNSQVMAATASAVAQKRIASIVEQIDDSVPEADQTTKIYRFTQGNAKYLYQAFSMMAPEAKIGYDPGANVVFVTASSEDHRILRDAADEVNGQAVDRFVKVYPLDPEKLTTDQVVNTLDDPMLSEITVQANEAMNSLIVRADQAGHDQVRQAIDSIMEALPDLPSMATKVYPLKLANSKVVATSLSELASDATIAADPDSNTLLVTANELDHQRIAQVVEDLDVASGADLTVKVYPVLNADARRIYDSLSRAFDKSKEYSITFQDATKSLYVIATPRNQAVFAEMFNQLDQQPRNKIDRVQKIYMLENIDANLAQSTIRSIAWGQNPGPDIHHNQSNNSLVIFATEQQHIQFRDAIDQLEGDPRELEVFQLVANDPWVIEQAINGMFRNLPGSTKPSVSTDFTTGKLFLRATSKHLGKIRELLAEMGEPIYQGQNANSEGNTRVIQFLGDTDALARQVEAIWPRIRSNRIQIITPADAEMVPPRGGTQPTESPKEKVLEGEQDTSDASLNGVKVPFANQPQSRPNQDTLGGSRTDRREGPLKYDALIHSDEMNVTRLVSQTETTRSPVPKSAPRKEIVSESNESDDALPPVFLVPGQSRITITSDDEKALDRLESILRAMAVNSGVATGQSNFAVFLLRNMGASDTKILLDQLFEDMNQRGLNDLVFVADERLNALIVHGSRHARDVIQELLETLDNAELPDPLDVYRPELITLEYAEASRVLEILENVYKTQLTSGGGRTPISIPKGVSSSVASLLQQINAASSGPVLTLDIDESSNSLIVRAPPELRSEIGEFLKTIDTQASTNSNRHVKVIRLSRTKSDRMQEVLQRFLVQPGAVTTSKTSSRK